jgi:hypothetical protein
VSETKAQTTTTPAHGPARIDPTELGERLRDLHARFDELRGRL